MKNTKKLLVVAILLFTCTVSYCILFRTCSTSKRPKDSQTTSRFVVVENYSTWKVVYDKETLVMYAVSDGAYSEGEFTLMVDYDGKPLTWKGGDK